MLTRRRILAAKIEGVEGVAEVITSADAGILAIAPKFDADIKMYERGEAATGTLSNPEQIPGAQSAKITFQAELKGAGAAYSATVKPAIGLYLRACGFAETVVTTAGSETVTYLPASTGVPCLTMWLYEDGVIKKAKGCRGNAKVDGKLGETLIVTFEFTGVFDGVADGAMPSVTLEQTDCPKFLNAGLTIGGYSPVFETFGLDMGNKLELRPSANTPTGYVSCLINARKPVVKLDPEMTTVAGRDWFGLWNAGTSAALNVGPVSGKGDYNKVAITAPKLTTTKVGEGDRAGNATAPIDGALAMNTGDDEVSIVFSK